MQNIEHSDEYKDLDQRLRVIEENQLSIGTVCELNLPVSTLVTYWFKMHKYLVLAQFEREIESIHTSMAVRVCLSRMNKAGQIKRIAKGVYVPS